MVWSLIAIAGQDEASLDVILKGISEFPVDKIYLLTGQTGFENATIASKELEKIAPTTIVKGNLSTVENMFSTVSDIKNDAAGEKFVINIESDRRTSSIMLSAAFVNGIQAIGLMDEKIIAYPIMKFSYYTVISDKKQKLLEIINREKTIDSLEYLSKEMNMSLPLVTYHIHGTREKQGLLELGLVKTNRKGKRLNVSITQLGSLVCRGYLEQWVECPAVKKISGVK